MDLVINQVEKLQDVDVADCDLDREWLAGAAIEKLGLSVGVNKLEAIAVGASNQDS